MVKKLATQKEVLAEDQDPKDILEKPELHQLILDDFAELAKVNKLNGLEKIKKLYVTAEPFTIENDILTPTMKIKRNIAKKVFDDKIQAIYAAGL